MNWYEVLCHPIFDGAFASEIEKTHLYEGRYKFTINELRNVIKIKNINIEDLFKNMGLEPSKNLSFEEFKKLIRNIS